tara:strand:- start:177 stop:443 length:267 start_codon:yes stop_codon:yes gene_type:complete
MNQKKTKSYLSYFNSSWVKPIVGIGFTIIILQFSSSLFQKNTNRGYVPTEDELQKRDWGERLDGLEKAMRDFELVTNAEEVAEKLRNP